MDSKSRVFSSEEKIILFIAFFTSIAACIISYFSGKILLYNDALAHLNTARRMVDSLTPGFVQIGSVWLPLLHLLELPFVTNYSLWQTGLAGTIISSVCFIFAALFLFKLLFLTTNNVPASYVGSFVFIFNTNLLYLQTTAMFESLLLFTFLGSVYYLTKWVKYRTLNDLLITSLFVMLSTLTRYDGWALAISESIFIAICCLKKRKEGIFFLFIFMAFFGIFLWLLYNSLIFGHPLYFANGEYSAFAQQNELSVKGQLLTKNNLVYSSLTYTLISLLNVGITGSLIFVPGVIFYVKKNIRHLEYSAPFLLFTPFLFNTLSLFLGQSVIWLPQLPPYFNTYFNARYGILMLPAVAFFCGYASKIHKTAAAVIFLLLLFQTGLFLGIYKLPAFPYLSGTIILRDATSSLDTDTIQASNHLKSIYQKGLILVSSASSDAFIFKTGIHLRNFITEGNGRFWRESLIKPVNHADYIVYFADKSDRVGKTVGDSSSLSQNYILIYRNEKYLIWQKKISNKS